MSVSIPTLKFQNLPQNIQKAFSDLALEMMRYDIALIFWKDVFDVTKLGKEMACEILQYLGDSNFSQAELGFHPVFCSWEYFIMKNLEDLRREIYYQTLFCNKTEFGKLQLLYVESVDPKISEDKLFQIDKHSKYENFTWHIKNSTNSNDYLLRLFPYFWVRKNNNISIKKLSNILNQINQESPDLSLLITPNPFLIYVDTKRSFKFEKYYGAECPSFEKLIDLQGKSFAEHGPADYEYKAKFCWDGANDRVELKCEILDTFNPNSCSLFLHAVIDKSLKSFIHMDGAVHQYIQGNYQDRLNKSLEHKIDVNKRKKIFRIDGTFSFQNGVRVIESFFNNRFVNEYLQIEKRY